MRYLKKPTEVEAILAKPTEHCLNEIIVLLRLMDPSISGNISFNKAIEKEERDYILIETPNYKAKLLLDDYIVFDLEANKPSVYSKLVFEKIFELNSKPVDLKIHIENQISYNSGEINRLELLTAKLNKELDEYNEILGLISHNKVAENYINTKDVEYIKSYIANQLKPQLDKANEYLNITKATLEELEVRYVIHKNLTKEFKIYFSENVTKPRTKVKNGRALKEKPTYDSEACELIYERTNKTGDQRLQDDED